MHSNGYAFYVFLNVHGDSVIFTSICSQILWAHRELSSSCVDHSDYCYFISYHTSFHNPPNSLPLSHHRSDHKINLCRKGISQSCLPYKRTPPAWLKVTPHEVVDHVTKLARKGLTPTQIGTILRDSHGIAKVKNVTGTRILRILRSNGTFLIYFTMRPALNRLLLLSLFAFMLLSLRFLSISFASR